MVSYLKDALQIKKIVIAWLPIALCIAGTVSMFLKIMTPIEWMTSSGIFSGIGTGGMVLTRDKVKKVGTVEVVGKR